MLVVYGRAGCHDRMVQDDRIRGKADADRFAVRQVRIGRVLRRFAPGHHTGCAALPLEAISAGVKDRCSPQEDSALVKSCNWSQRKLQSVRGRFGRETVGRAGVQSRVTIRSGKGQSSVWFGFASFAMEQEARSTLSETQTETFHDLARCGRCTSQSVTVLLPASSPLISAV